MGIRVGSCLSVYHFIIFIYVPLIVVCFFFLLDCTLLDCPSSFLSFFLRIIVLFRSFCYWGSIRVGLFESHCGVGIFPFLLLGLGFL